MPLGFIGGFELNSFKKGITLNKDYIIQRMSRNENYRLYVPSNIDAHKLTRRFLLAGNINFIIYLASGIHR